MSNRNRSNKRQTRVPVWFNDHVVGTFSQNRMEIVDMSTGKENSVQNLEINVAVQNTVTGKKGGDKKNGVHNTVNEVEVNTNGSDPKEVMNAEINSSDTVNEFPKELLYIPTEMNEARNEVVVFNEMLVKNGSERWMLTACGQFIGFHMHISELSGGCRVIGSSSGPKLPAVVLVLEIKGGGRDNGWVLKVAYNIVGFKLYITQSQICPLRCKFDSLGPWMVQNKPLFIHKWSPEMGMQKIEPKKLPVWVKMSNVPLEGWSLKRVSALASNLGKPMVIDNMTASMCYKGVGNLDYARVLVEINAEKEINMRLKCSIEIWKTKLKPARCVECKVFGHDIGRCIFNKSKDDGLDKQAVKDNM
ncbi:ATPase, F1/V1/A1 complex, alpha/beta subunit, Zinc knuckle CX2CX4HX4C [Artemisia annua]|uniref:ATPase, F1/V1/A1 complex, alpha/beta subunit, Zinc knuckle CX2CX4HX4C n=1 Tax=Artemisia annua TaxID=35608 RepID=A0A2U1PSI8_ARTAN|nr:ATPase, F1/V1/A1 complex, alpha/beta subunit, Zinc knuckle CX2CX4HX4C [Artemisia annua]